MAKTNEQLIKELNDLKKEYETLSKSPAPDFGTSTIKQTTAAIKSMQQAVKAAYEEVTNVKDTFKDVRDSVQESLKEIDKQADSINLSKKAMRGVLDIVEKLESDEKGISELSKKDLERAKEKLKIREKELTNQAELIKDEYKIKDIKTAQLGTIENLSDEARAILENYQQGFQDIQRTNKLLDDRLDKEKKINSALGIGGGLLKGIEGSMDKLGLGAISQSLGFDEANEKMKEQAKLVTDNGNKAAGLAGKTQVLMAGITSVGKNLLKSLTDPLVIFGAMLKGALDLNKAQTEYGRLTGNNISQIDTLNTRLITGVQYIKAATDLTQQFGMAADAVFTPDDIAEVAEMTTQIGLSADEAGKLAALSKLNGKEIADQNKNIIDEVNNFGKVNKVALNKKQILQDVAKASTSFQVSMGGNEKAIARAAAEARKLGLELATMEKVADGLLNFEQSISAELEAELLTGKELNLDRARTLALNNDLEGVAKEIGRNHAVISSFSKGNRIQQEAIAKSLGLSRDEVAKMVVAEKMRNKTSTEGLSNAEKATYEEMKRLEVQEKFSTALAKVQQALAPILTGFAELLSHTEVLYPLLIGIGTVIAFRIANGIARAVKSAGGLGGVFKQMLGFSKTVTESQNQQPSGGGQGPGGFLKSLGDGLASIGGRFMDVVKGGIALGLVVAALAGGFWVAMKALQDVDPVLLITFSGALAILGLTVAVMGKMSGDIIKGALALGIVAVALIPAAYAFSLLAGVDMGTLIAFSIALPLMALAAAGLGFLFVPILAGAVALLALGAALIPATYAFSLLENVDTEMIKTFGESIYDLALNVAKMGILFIPLALGALSLIVLGGALAAFAVMAAFAAKIAPDLSLLKESIVALADPEVLTGLEGSGPALAAAGIGAALFGIGLAALGKGLFVFSFGAAAAAVVAPGLEPLFDQLIKLADPVLAAGLLMTAGALIPLSIGLMAFGSALAFVSAGNVIGNILGLGSGGGAIAQLERLARISNPLKQAASSISELAVGLKQVADALKDLDVETIEALEDFVITEALSSAGKNIVSAFTAPLRALGNLFGGGEEKSDTQLLMEIRDLLMEIKMNEGSVQLDGNKVGTALAMGKYKTQ